MKNIYIYKTEYNNNYLVSALGSYHIYLNPLVIFFIKLEGRADFKLDSLPKELIIEDYKYGEEEIIHNYNKYLFLKRNGLLDISHLPSLKIGLINEDDIKLQLANLTNLSFEITEACNLKCRYCTYGEFYDNNDARCNRSMAFETAKTIIDYLIILWKSTLNHSAKRNFTFSFYGGEPLLKIKLIKKIIEYIEHVSPKSIDYAFNMTTNAMLLHKYMGYLVFKKFKLLISLDGNYANNSYRITNFGDNSFSQVYKNVKLLKKKYPDFFNSNVNFNAVLHNRNSLDEILTFFSKEFGKDPQFTPLSESGIKRYKRMEFNYIFGNVKEGICYFEECDELDSKNELSSPSFHEASMYVNQNIGNNFRSYVDMFPTSVKHEIIPTGTCLPFAKKMFVTASGNILPCERIGFQYYLGKIIKNKVELNLQNIAIKYNEYFSKLKKECTHCYSYSLCSYCIFHINDLQGKPVCNHRTNSKQLNRYISSIISFFEANPAAYKKSIDMVIT
jgi:uncharacterized protein